MSGNADTGVEGRDDRACEVAGWAGIVDVGTEGFGLVPADEPATTCFLPERNLFVRWLAADPDAGLLDAAGAVLDDPAPDPSCMRHRPALEYPGRPTEINSAV